MPYPLQAKSIPFTSPVRLTAQRIVTAAAVMLIMYSPGFGALDLFPLYYNSTDYTALMYPFTVLDKHNSALYIKPLLRYSYVPYEKRVNIWPLFYYQDGQNMTAWGINPLLSYRKHNDAFARFSLIPIIDIRRDGPHSTMFFPLYGNIRGAYGFEHARFYLFPLYGFSERGEYASSYFLWPIFARHTKNGERVGCRFFPLFSIYNDPPLIKRSFAWPLYTAARTDEESGVFFFPFYGRLENKTKKSKVFLWPFIKTTKKKDGTTGRTDYFWPFLRSYTGTLTHGFEVWPLYGDYTKRGVRQRYFLWPIFRKRDDKDGTERLLAGPYSRKTVQGNPTPVTTQLWPLYSKCRTDEKTEIHMLDIFWFRVPGYVEKLYSPLNRLIYYTHTDNHSEWGLADGIVALIKTNGKLGIRLPFIHRGTS